MRMKRGKVAGLPPQGKARSRRGRRPRVAPERIPSARKLQRTLYRTAKGQPERKFTSLYDKVYRLDVLEEAYQRVKRNGGAAGVDKISFVEIEDVYGRERFLGELLEELRRGTYRTNKVRRVYIPKPGQPGRQRPLGIPTVKDRVVQMAVKMVIEPLFEADFLPCSYGFRPKRTPRQALSRIAGSLRAGYGHVVDVDLRSYFDTIDHENLMRLVERRVKDIRVLRLIRAWLKAGILDEGKVQSPIRGTPQGGVISPLLSNIYLHEVDRAWSETAGEVPGDVRLVRYADDMVLLTRTEAEAERAWQRLQCQFKSLDLEVNEEKSRLAHVSEGFTFLGFEFRTNRRRLYMWPRSKAVKHIGERVRGVIRSMPPHTTTLWELTRKLNRVLNGWCTYFRVGNSNKVFHKVDWMVRSTVQLWLRRKHRIPWSRAMKRWNYSVLHNTVGLYRMVGKVSYLEGLRPAR